MTKTTFGLKSRLEMFCVCGPRWHLAAIFWYAFRSFSNQFLYFFWKVICKEANHHSCQSMPVSMSATGSYHTYFISPALPRDILPCLILPTLASPSPVLSHPILFRPIPSGPIPSHPVPSRPIPSHPVLSTLVAASWGRLPSWVCNSTLGHFASVRLLQ